LRTGSLKSAANLHGRHFWCEWKSQK